MQRAFLFAALSLLSLPARAADSPVTIHAGRLLDGRGGVLTDVTVTVQGPRIVAVEPGRKGTPTWDLRDFTLMPGGIDTHVHLSWHFDPDGRTHHDESEAPARSEVGTAAPGYEADLIAVEGDPLQDIRALKRVVWVMKSGRVVRNEPWNR